MASVLRLDLTEMVRVFGACHECVNIAQFLADNPTPGATRADIAAAFRAAGYVSGYAATGKRRDDLLVYENWLHREVRLWCEGRRSLTIDQFAAAHPDFPNDGATRREIAGALGRLGYARAYVRTAP